MGSAWLSFSEEGARWWEQDDASRVCVTNGVGFHEENTKSWAKRAVDFLASHSYNPVFERYLLII
jgi:hypothetical protein